MPLETGASLKEVVDKAEQISADLQIKKEALATAITSKKVPTNANDSLQVMKDNIDSIKTKLPILEGDVGVTEDSEGNIYGVDKIINKHVYALGTRVSTEWSYAPSENESITKLDIDSQGNIYCGNKRVVKISPEGKEIWFDTVGGLTSITVDKDDNIYYSTSTKIGKIDSNKELIWEKAISVSGRIVFDNNYLYSFYNYGVSKRTLDGDIIWTKNGISSINSIGVDNKGNVYYGNANKELWKLSPEGERIWSLGDHVSNVYSLAVDSEGYAYTGSAGVLRKITPDGEMVWQIEIGNTVIYEIRIDGVNNVYCANGNKVYKFSPDNEEYWGFNDHTLGVFCLAVDNKGYVYSGSGDRTVKKIKDNYKLEKIAVLKEREVQ